jgi:hypothetical protein
VGFFGEFIFSDGEWVDAATAEQFLKIELPDGDIATVEYQPASRGLGRFYLGYEPRHLFDDPDASRPVDVGAEVHAFVRWAAAVLHRTIPAGELTPLFAKTDGREPDDIFAEDTVIRLIKLLGLPLPKALDVTVGRT